MTGVLVEQPGGGGHGDGARRPSEKAHINVLARGDPAMDAPEQNGIEFREPAQTGGKVTFMDSAACTLVDFHRVDFCADPDRAFRGAVIRPGVKRSNGLSTSVYPHHAVPKSAAADGLKFFRGVTQLIQHRIDALRDEIYEIVRIKNGCPRRIGDESVRSLGSGDRSGGGVVGDGASAGSADVQCKDEAVF